MFQQEKCSGRTTTMLLFPLFCSLRSPRRPRPYARIFSCASWRGKGAGLGEGRDVRFSTGLGEDPWRAWSVLQDDGQSALRKVALRATFNWFDVRQPCLREHSIFESASTKHRSSACYANEPPAWDLSILCLAFLGRTHPSSVATLLRGWTHLGHQARSLQRLNAEDLLSNQEPPNRACALARKRQGAS